MYTFLKLYCKVALRFFYKKWQVHHLQPVPTGAVIFVANHQNAFLDAILISCSTTRNPYFIARAGVFKNKTVNHLLRSIRMIPIYRFRDGYETLKNNEAAFADYIDLLRNDEAILIFAEGNHDERWHLRNFQKGFSKLAFAAAESTHVSIVPVGLQYDAHSALGSRVLVTFGVPIEVPVIPPTKNLRVAYTELIKRVQDAVKSSILHLDAENYEHQLNYLQVNRTYKSDLAEQLKSDQKLINELARGNSSFQPEISTEELKRRPLYFYNYANHALARFLIHSLLKNFVKDPQFIGSIKFAAGMFVVPACYVFQSTAIYLLTNSILIATTYLISLPLSFKYLRKAH